MKTVLFCGHGRAGKDTACEYLAEITFLRNAGTTSKYLTKYVAAKKGIPEEEAYATRHQERELWYHTGNEVREQGPTTLIREALKHGEITGGIRDLEEILAARRENVVDLIVWVQNDRVPADPTVKFTSREADLVIENNWGLEEFHERIERFARFAGLPMRGEAPRDKTVHVVLHDNYGDQGKDFWGVFDNREAAEEFVAKKERRKCERQWWEIEETPVLSGYQVIEGSP